MVRGMGRGYVGLVAGLEEVGEVEEGHVADNKFGDFQG